MKARIVKSTDKEFKIKVQGVRTLIEIASEDGYYLNFGEQEAYNILALCAFPFAMRKGLDLHIEHPLSEELKQNLNRYSMIWSQWRPDKFRKFVNISSPDAQSDKKIAKSRKYVMAFSGGVDSIYTLLKHKENTQSLPDIRYAIMINGFGYDLKESTQYYNQLKKNEFVCSELGVKLYGIRTNINKVLSWYPIFHSLNIAAMLYTMSSECRGGVVSLDYTYAEELALGPWGNLAVIDILASSAEFKIFPSGADNDRIEKIKYIHEKGFSQYITVCNNVKNSGNNCGLCEKCLRTLLMFYAAKIMPPEGLFDNDLKLENFKKINIKKRTQFIFYKLLEKNLSEGCEYREEVEKKLSAAAISWGL